MKLLLCICAIALIAAAHSIGEGTAAMDVPDLTNADVTLSGTNEDLATNRGYRDTRHQPKRPPGMSSWRG